LFPFPDKQASTVQPCEERIQLPRREACALHQFVAVARFFWVGKKLAQKLRNCDCDPHIRHG
jgi:hypothetical protein